LLAAALCVWASVANAQTAAIDGEALYQQALHWMADGRNAEAREALLQLLALQPEHAGAWLDLAVLHCNMGQDQEAEALFATVTDRFAPPPALQLAVRPATARAATETPPPAPPPPPPPLMLLLSTSSPVEDSSVSRKPRRRTARAAPSPAPTSSSIALVGHASMLPLPRRRRP
jgi:hypothetical protein